MKTRKILSYVLAGVMSLGLLASCTGNNETADTGTTAEAGETEKPAVAEVTTTTPVSAEAVVGDALTALGLDENGRFTETRKIKVEVYDRSNDGGSKPEDNFYTDFVKKSMLDKYNIEVTYVPVPRWTEGDEINNLLASGTAPDVCVTYSYPTIQTYANMGGVTDLGGYLTEYQSLLPELWSFLGPQNLFWDQDPTTGTVWAIEARLANSARISTFVRSDWLEKLGLSEPTNIDEFEAMLHAFKDNAETLLGADASKIIPFSTSYDVGWRTDHLTAAFVPDALTDKDVYVYGFDDRHLLFPGFKEGIRKLNQWYNEGLSWNDFAIYPAGDPTEDNYLKAGYVGSFIHNWDYPYRNGDDSVIANMRSLVGPEAEFTTVTAFKNDAGLYKKFLAAPIDRKVFFPKTNTEPLASLLYLNWLSDYENLNFLQVGEAGVTHEVTADGAYKTLAATGEKIMNSLNNIDMTITINGLEFPDKAVTAASRALGYAGIDADEVTKAYNNSIKDGRVGKAVNVGEITAEANMGPALTEKRDVFLDQAVVAPVDSFDAIYDAGMADYLASGGQAIIDERKAKWEQFFGDAVELPETGFYAD